MTKTSTVSAMTFMFNQQGDYTIFQHTFGTNGWNFHWTGLSAKQFQQKRTGTAIVACIIRQFNLTISSDCKDR